jgi:hypothetical protein
MKTIAILLILATLLAVKAEENGRGTFYVVNVRFWSYQELLQIYIIKRILVVLQIQSTILFLKTIVRH